MTTGFCDPILVFKPILSPARMSNSTESERLHSCRLVDCHRSVPPSVVSNRDEV